VITYSRSAQYYDALITAGGKDYARESALVADLVERYKRSPGRELLDVACGTGRHIEHLRERSRARASTSIAACSRSLRSARRTCVSTSRT